MADEQNPQMSPEEQAALGAPPDGPATSAPPPPAAAQPQPRQRTASATPARTRATAAQVAASQEQAAQATQAKADREARIAAGAPLGEDPQPDAPASAGTGGPYLVLHGMVGEWPQGTIVTADELEAANVDEAGVQRLLDLGAIAPYRDEPDAKE